MTNAVGWFEIYVQDAARARAFYEGVFSVKLEKLPIPGIEMLTFPMTAEGTGSSGALVHSPECPSGGNSVVIYFSSHDCAVEEGRVATFGGRVHRGKMSIGQYGFVTLAFDTEGNMIGIHSPS